MNSLDKKIIDETTKRFADDPEVANRLFWWLQHGFSCERWFQFEWAFKLESVLKCRYPGTYVVGCERDRIDVVIYQQPFQPERPLYQQNYSAGIELKWCGNWSANSSIAETEKDLQNIRENIKYSCPVLALSVWLFATPSQNSNPFYSWITKQIQKEMVNWETLQQKLTSLECNFMIGPYEIACQPGFGKLEIFCVGFYNEKAYPSDRSITLVNEQQRGS